MPMSPRSLLPALLAAFALVGAAGCATGNPPVAANAVTVAAHRADLSTFHRLVQSAGMGAALSSGSYTVFAPNNAAFNALPAATMDKLGRDPEYLKTVLSYHVLPKRVMSGAIDANMAADTLGGNKLAVSKAGEMITVDEGLVVQADVAAGDSIVHVIDAVLLPAVKK